MAAIGIGRAPLGLWHRLTAHFGAPGLDARLAAGEDPLGSVALASRAAQLVSSRLRSQLARGLEHACSSSEARAGFSSAVPADPDAVDVARPVLEQLARALRSRERVDVSGVALTQVLLTDPGSALYRSSHPEELYERARDALFALGADVAPRVPSEWEADSP